MGKEGDLSDFEYSTVVGVRLAGLSFFQKLLISWNFPHTTISRGFIENGENIQ